MNKLCFLFSISLKPSKIYGLKQVVRSKVTMAIAMLTRNTVRTQSKGTYSSLGSKGKKKV